jgi:hypothetical protein
MKIAKLAEKETTEELFDVLLDGLADSIADGFTKDKAEGLCQDLKKYGIRAKAFQSTSGRKALEIPEDKMLVSNEALSEIRVTLWGSLEMAIDWAFENPIGYHVADMATLIRPAVERLKAICEENDFPV